MKARGLRRAACLAGALTASIACAQSPRVLETFEVGANVYVRALAIEGGTLWVGTSAGVNEVDLASGALRRTFTRRDGLANEYVFAIGVDRQGYKWFGTNAGGASRYKDGKWKTYFPMHGLADYWVYAFANDRAGKVWIGTWAGASLFDPATGRFRNYVKELVNVWVYAISVDSSGRAWFGTEGGVSMFDGGKWESWTHADGVGAPNTGNLPASPNTGLGTRSRHDLSVLAEGGPTYNPGYVFSILAAAEGMVWAGTWGGGVSRFDGKRWSHLTRAQGLAGDVVYSIARDARGVFWFGTDRGLSRYDGKAWMRLGHEHGLRNEHVYALALAPSGDVWAGTRGAVVRIGAR